MKTRRTVTLNKLFHQKIEDLAKTQNRSFSEILERLAEKGMEVVNSNS
jgi:predicted DNA-binding ribbon-helix-helix protein